MREILFRGKRVDNGEWIKGFYIEANHHWHNKGVHKEWIVKNVIQNGGWCNVGSKYAVIPETVGQYTGLTDKNGTKIFEGDIIKIPDDYEQYGHNAGQLYAVYFAFGGFRLKPKFNKEARGYWLEDDGIVEVIGNIHDNPELLGVE